MKKTISIILAAVLALGCIFGFAACSSGSKSITIAVPNDATNEARALLLLQEQGIIKLIDAGAARRKAWCDQQNHFPLGEQQLYARC